MELTPSNEHGEAVCNLFHQYLAARPPAFRAPLSFLKKGDFELDWSAAAGGVALASLHQGDTPLLIGVLLSGADAGADIAMAEVFRENVLNPLFGSDFDSATAVAERPLVVQVIFPGQPEWTPALQLLSASLASVYFRTIIQLRCESGQ